MHIKVSQSTRFHSDHRIVGSVKEDQEDIIHDEKQTFFTGVGTTFYPISEELHHVRHLHHKVLKFLHPV